MRSEEGRIPGGGRAAARRFLLLTPHALLLTALIGCAPRPIERVEAPEAAKPGLKAGKKPSAAPKKGGGYYKDDGPTDDIPDGLDDIPDAEPRAEPLHRFANKPYVVLGKEYVPNTSVKPYKARGIASWYGRKFHGQKTSIGEPYDMFAMTAAHPTLAIPSFVRVTSAGSGRSVVVRVTDRGPFHADRVIDLSYTAAYKLGFINQGRGAVEVEAILPGEAGGVTYAQVAPPEPRPAALPAPRDEIAELAQSLRMEETLSAAPLRGVFLQLGAFSSADNAESLRAHLARDLDWLSEPIRINAGGGLHRLHLGPYPSRAEAEKVAEKIRFALGYKPTFVTR